MAASLKGISPELKKYLRIYKLPDVYEALLTGLAVMCPDDPHDFIVKCLQHIQDAGLRGMEWDMFVEEDMKPKRKFITESNLEYIFNLDDYSWQPTPEMYAMAYNHYNTKMKTVCFTGWMQYHLQKRQRRDDAIRNWKKATVHHAHRLLRIHIREWNQWVRFRKGRQIMAFNKLQHIHHVVHGRVIFKAWHSVTLDARKTREYFEINLRRLERGENMEEEDMFSKSSGEARDDISMLPKKAQIKIFSSIDIDDLCRCSRVCRSWKVITQSSSLWTRLDFHAVRNKLFKGVTDQVTRRLLGKCRPYLVNLNLRCCDLITKSTFTAVGECRNLQDLNLSECKALTDETLKQVVEGCTILLYLNVSHTDITDAGLRSIAKHSVNLQYLSLAFAKRFTDKGLHYLSMGKGAMKLIYLDLSGCEQITSLGFQNVGRGCKNIASLILNEYPAVSDDCIEAITEYCKSIGYLSLLGTPFLSDDSFKKLANGSKLKKLKIDGNQRISDNTMKAIGKNCRELQHLYMVDCQRITDYSLKALAGCRNLTVLNLADCVRISDTGVRYIVDSPCGPILKELNLTNCIRVGDIALVNIHKRCKSLNYLSVCFCEHISEAGIELLGQTHSLTSLDISGCHCADQGLSALGNNPGFRDVTLAECSGITDLGLQKFAQQCKEVERLDLSFCYQLTDGAIKNLAFCCRQISYLNLAGCKLLTDLSIQYLSGVCHHLAYLDLSGCILVTDKALRYLRKGCRKLRELLLLYCKGITKSGAQRCVKQMEMVQWNDDEVPGYYNY